MNIHENNELCISEVNLIIVESTNISSYQVKYTKHNLKKIQDLLEEVGYEVRFEKGNFQSGYCLVETRKIAVVNKFFDTEGRMNVLLDILSNIGVDPETLSDDSKKLFKKLILLDSSKEENQ